MEDDGSGNTEMSNQATPCSASSNYSGTSPEQRLSSASDSMVGIAFDNHGDCDSFEPDLSLNLLQDTTPSGGEDFGSMHSEIEWSSSDWGAIPNFTFDEQRQLSQTGPLFSWTDVSDLPTDTSTVQLAEDALTHLIESDHLEPPFRLDPSALESHPYPAPIPNGQHSQNLSQEKNSAGAEDGTKGSVTLILSRVNADIAREMIEEVMRHNANLKIQIVTD